MKTTVCMYFGRTLPAVHFLAEIRTIWINDISKKYIHFLIFVEQKAHFPQPFLWYLRLKWFSHLLGTLYKKMHVVQYRVIFEIKIFSYIYKLLTKFAFFLLQILLLTTWSLCMHALTFYKTHWIMFKCICFISYVTIHYLKR